MGDLALETAVEGSDGRYRAHLSRDWAAWGPVGGYVAAIALRAVAAESAVPRPATFSCQYLGVADFDAVDLEVVTLRASRRSASLRVSMTQSGRAILEGLASMVAAGADGFVHDAAPMPDVPSPHGLRSWEDLYPDDPNPYRIWSNIEARPFDWTKRWIDRPRSGPVYRHWFRFRPRPTFDDPISDAARLLVLIDLLGWPGAAVAYPSPLPYIAPTMDLDVRFHRAEPESEWLFARATSPIAEAGLIAAGVEVWSEKGRLLASGAQHMLCRPAPEGFPG